MENSIKQIYHVGGMNCGGCVAGVIQKLSAVGGITSVIVDLAKKQTEITSTEGIAIEALRNALMNTRYTIADFNQ